MLVQRIPRLALRLTTSAHRPKRPENRLHIKPMSSNEVSRHRRIFRKFFATAASEPLLATEVRLLPRYAGTENFLCARRFVTSPWAIVSCSYAQGPAVMHFMHFMQGYAVLGLHSAHPLLAPLRVGGLGQGTFCMDQKAPAARTFLYLYRRGTMD